MKGLVLKNRKINSILQRVFVNLHNFSYKVISRLVVIDNNGLHPKHRIMNYHQFFVNNIGKEDIAGLKLEDYSIQFGKIWAVVRR